MYKHFESNLIFQPASVAIHLNTRFSDTFVSIQASIYTHTHTHTHTHRVIQEKRPIFWEVTTCHCEKIRSHKHVSKSEWLPRYSCLNVARTVLPSLFCPDPTPLDVCLWGLMNSEVYERKVDILDKLVTRILDAAARIKNVKITETNNTRSSHASCKVHYS